MLFESSLAESEQTSGTVSVIDPSSNKLLGVIRLVQRIVERMFLIEVVSFDWNCQEYITPRYTVAEVEKAVLPFENASLN